MGSEGIAPSSQEKEQSPDPGRFKGVLGASLEDLDETHLTELIRLGTRENEQLDFKRRVYGPTRGAKPDWTEEQEFAKDVAAFANHRGGVLLVGVEDTNDVATGLSPVVGLVFGAEEQRHRHALANYLAPSTAVEFRELKAASGGWYMAVIVPPSPSAPHSVGGVVGDHRRPHHVPIRTGSDTQWATEAVIADRYHRRFATEADHAATMERLTANGLRALVEAPGVWLCVAFTPATSSTGYVTNDFVREGDDWFNRCRINGPLQGYLPTFGRPIPGPGFVALADSARTSNEDPAINDGYLELHVSGACFAAVPTVRRSSSEGQYIGELTLVEDLIILCDVALGWGVRQSGAWGAGTMQAFIVEPALGPEARSILREPIELGSSLYDVFRRLGGTRSLTQPPSIVATCDLASVATTQQRLGVTFRLASGLLQHFGIAEPEQLRVDGSIAPRAWGLGERARQVAAWARSHDVDAEPI